MNEFAEKIISGVSIFMIPVIIFAIFRKLHKNPFPDDVSFVPRLKIWYSVKTNTYYCDPCKKKKIPSPLGKTDLGFVCLHCKKTYQEV